MTSRPALDTALAVEFTAVPGQLDLLDELHDTDPPNARLTSATARTSERTHR
jgi:hypothetical protein